MAFAVGGAGWQYFLRGDLGLQEFKSEAGDINGPGAYHQRINIAGLSPGLGGINPHTVKSDKV